MTAAYRIFLTMAAGRYPSLRWVQNRGFGQIEPCAALLDGFLWEDFAAGLAATSWTEQWLRVLQRQRSLGLSVLTATARTGAEHRREAERCGFVHWTSPAELYNTLD
jgi:hypothetical protein